MSETPSKSTGPPVSPPTPPPEKIPEKIIDSRDLFDGRREVLIRHGAETYRLLLTSNNKLILNK